ncbi:hypothetical protein KC334_g6157 [Hortaea werneckii]|nr:hypothetical protein KC334_g6157 [Hortaea werneckii]
MDSPSLPVSKAITKVCKTSTGFSAISDVKAPDGGDKLDMQESFVFAEVLKYVYLLHLEDNDNALHVQDSRYGAKNQWVYNTEAHPFRVVGRLVPVRRTAKGVGAEQSINYEVGVQLLRVLTGREQPESTRDSQSEVQGGRSSVVMLSKIPNTISNFSAGKVKRWQR